jgi:hypothetical protein
MLRLPSRAVLLLRSFSSSACSCSSSSSSSSSSSVFSATRPRAFDPRDPKTKPPPDYSAFVNFDEKLKKAQARRQVLDRTGSSSSEDSTPVIATDGPPSIGRLGPLKRENRPRLTDSALKGVVFDLGALLNFFPAGDNGDAALKPELVSDERWNVGNGARETMMWVEGRGLQTAVLPRLALSADVAGDLVDFTVGSFQEKLGHSFERVLGNVHAVDKDGAARVVEKELLQECRHMGLEPKEVMVVTLSPMVVAAAKRQHMHTTVLKNGSQNGKAQRLANFKIGALAELKGVVEELNGISYRKDAVEAGAPR